MVMGTRRRPEEESTSGRAVLRETGRARRLVSTQEAIRTSPKRVPAIEPSKVRTYAITGTRRRAQKCIRSTGVEENNVTKLPGHLGGLRQASSVRAQSSGRRNSKPKRRISPAESWRKTLATMGGVSLGTRLEDVGVGAGMVR